VAKAASVPGGAAAEIAERDGASALVVLDAVQSFFGGNDATEHPAERRLLSASSQPSRQSMGPLLQQQLQQLTPSSPPLPPPGLDANPSPANPSLLGRGSATSHWETDDGGGDDDDDDDGGCDDYDNDSDDGDGDGHGSSNDDGARLITGAAWATAWEDDDEEDDDGDDGRANR